MKDPLRVSEVRELTSPERVLLDRLLQYAAPEARLYAEQLAHVTVVSRCGCGCPTIDLAVEGQAASLESPSEILAEAGGMSPEGVPFGIILHARGGLLSELEVYPFEVEDKRSSLPEIDQIEFYDPT